MGNAISRRRIIIALAALGLLAVLAFAGIVLSDLFRSDAPLCAAASAQPAPAPTPTPESGGPRVVVYKSRRQLILFRDGMEPKSYRITLGTEPDGDKERRGDCRTPLGTFYVCEKNQKSKFYLFVAISYPNEEDAARGLEHGLITRAQHDAIARAIAAHKTPPWHTRLGGEIGIHGGGTAWDWTQGCVAVDNADMRELYAEIPIGAEVTIEP